jgi:hypothetical protein
VSLILNSSFLNLFPVISTREAVNCHEPGR